MNITKGKIKSAYKVVIYGPEGIGKSTMASQFPAPVYIDTEGSTVRMDVDRFDTPNSFDDVLADLDQIYKEDHNYKTLVIDTMDKLELMINDKVCQEQNVTGIEAIGYGKGYTFAAEKVNKLLGKLDVIRMARGMNIVIICHGQMRKFEQPDEMGAYDRWELKLSKKVAPMVKEWADMVLFSNYKTYVVKSETGTKKAQGGKRVMYTTHNPAWDAKNRDNLPEVLDFDFKGIAHLFGEESEKKVEKKPEKKAEPKPEPKPEPKKEEPAAEEKPFPPKDMNETEKKLRELMDKAGFTEAEVMHTFHEKDKFTGIMVIAEIDDWAFIEKSVIGNWAGFSKAVEKYGQSVPFIDHKDKGGRKRG